MTQEKQPVEKWDAQAYTENFHFIATLGTSLLDILNPQPHETVIDLGCGTGELTDKLAQRCKAVIGLDYSAAMVETAKKAFPHIEFRQANAIDFSCEKPVDALLSNAVLHWVTEPEKAIQQIYNALKPDGRFVAEFGGKHNVKTIMDGVKKTLKDMKKPWKDYWYFPSIADYSALLEKEGFWVEQAWHFQRPTPMTSGENGLKDWLKMFVSPHMTPLTSDEESLFFNQVETYCKPTLFRDNLWVLDYVRFRVLARKI